SAIHVDLTAEGAAGRGPLELAASGRIEPDGRREIDIRRLRFDLDDSSWSLARPARVAWGGTAGLTVEDLLLREISGPGVVALDGSYPPGESADLRIEAVDLPVGEFLVLAGYQPVLVGTISLDLRASGP